MEIGKLYILQCITAAANNLRLSAEKIEVVTILKDIIKNSANLGDEILKMKKITELSKFAVKIDEVYKSISGDKIDFLKVSDRFKDHTAFLLKDMSIFLDVVNPGGMKDLALKLSYHDFTSAGGTEVRSKEAESALSQPKPAKDRKEPLFLPAEGSNNIDFENFETRILEPIRNLDILLKKIEENEAEPDEIKKYEKIMFSNAEISAGIGFGVISNMHRIFGDSLMLISCGKLSPDGEIIEGMRACLIVIAAVVRGKAVDIKEFLMKAEKLGEFITKK